MPKVPARPYCGPLAVDVTPIAAMLSDLNPGGMQRLRREQKGFDAVSAELRTQTPAGAALIGINAEVFARVESATEQLAQVRAALADVAKLAEVLAETEAKLEHERENDVSLIASAVRSTARHRDPSVTALYERTLEYNSRLARKAAKTRRRMVEVTEQAAVAPGEAGGLVAPR